jgi:hypothetical protein
VITQTVWAAAMVTVPPGCIPPSFAETVTESFSPDSWPTVMRDSGCWRRSATLSAARAWVR